MSNKEKKPMSAGSLVAIALSVSLVLGIIASSFATVYAVSSIGKFFYRAMPEFKQYIEEYEGSIKATGDEEKSGKYTVNDTINELNINWKYGNVFFKSDAKATKITVSETSSDDIADGSHMCVDCKNGSLDIYYFKDYFRDTSLKKDITITFPSSYMKKTDLDISVDIAKGNVSGEIYCDEFSTDIVDGDVKITNGIFNETDINTVNGDVVLASDKSVFDCNINSVGTKVKLYYPKSAGFDIDKDGLVMKYEIIEKEYFEGKDTAEIDVDCVGGSLTIDSFKNLK